MYGANPINHEELEKIANKFGLTSNDIEITDGFQDRSFLDLIWFGFCSTPQDLSEIAQIYMYTSDRAYNIDIHKLRQIQKRYAHELDKYGYDLIDHPAIIQVKKSHRVLASLFSPYVHDDVMETNFIFHLFEELKPIIFHEYRKITNIKLPMYADTDFKILQPSNSLYYKNQAATFIWMYKKYYGKGKKLLEPIKGVTLINDFSEDMIRRKNNKPDSIELYNKHFSAWPYENIFINPAKQFNNETLTFEDFYNNLNEVLPDGWFLGRPNYNWLVADGLFKPFDGCFGTHDSFLKKHEKQRDNNRYNVIPIYKKLDNGRKWLYVANFIYEGYVSNRYADPLVLLDNYDVKGWKIAWSITLNDGEELFNQYLTKLNQLTGISSLPMLHSKYPTEDEHITTTITHTQFVDLK